MFLRQKEKNKKKTHEEEKEEGEHEEFQVVFKLSCTSSYNCQNFLLFLRWRIIYICIIVYFIIILCFAFCIFCCSPLACQFIYDNYIQLIIYWENQHSIIIEHAARTYHILELCIGYTFQESYYKMDRKIRRRQCWRQWFSAVSLIKFDISYLHNFDQVSHFDVRVSLVCFVALTAHNICYGDKVEKKFIRNRKKKCCEICMHA